MIPMPAPTHTGWFVVCPVYLAHIDDDGPVIWERSPWFWPLFELSLLMHSAAIAVLTVIDPDYEPEWMFWRVEAIHG